MTPKGRLLGVDFGSVRIGLAISDADRIIASPLATYERRGSELDTVYLRDLIQKEQVAGIVVGLPVHLNGREGKKALESRQYGAWLQLVSGLPVAFADERFTTVDAEDALWNAGMTHKQRKGRRDRVAAQIMLQAYLDAGCPAEAELRGLDE